MGCILVARRLHRPSQRKWAQYWNTILNQMAQMVSRNELHVLQKSTYHVKNKFNANKQEIYSCFSWVPFVFFQLFIITIEPHSLRPQKERKNIPFFLFYSPIFVTYVYDFDSHNALKFAILYPTPLPLSNKSLCFFTEFCEKSIFRILEFNDTSKPNCWWGRAITYIGVVGCFSFT